MNVSDVVIGIVLMLVLFWNIMIVVEQRDMATTIAAVSFAQQNLILFSPSNLCSPISGYSLVPGQNIEAKEYLITAGIVPDTNQHYFCFYEARS